MALNPGKVPEHGFHTWKLEEREIGLKTGLAWFYSFEEEKMAEAGV